MALPETLPFDLPTFVGREKELRWLEDHVFFQERWHTPIFITGLTGVGKTELLRRFFTTSTNRISYMRFPIPILIDLSSEQNPTEATNEFIEELYNRKFPAENLIIGIDGADPLTDEQLQRIVSNLRDRLDEMTRLGRHNALWKLAGKKTRNISILESPKIKGLRISYFVLPIGRKEAEEFLVNLWRKHVKLNKHNGRFQRRDDWNTFESLHNSCGFCKRSRA